jgi:hypothetical protein
MGFTVTESTVVPDRGISISGAYCTIKGSYQQIKTTTINNTPGYPYILTARWWIYSSINTLQPLFESNIILTLPTSTSTPIVDLYTAIKAQYFAGKTCVDDL